jgi:autotransporter-associated beta strand protein
MKTAANKKITIQAVRSLHPREALLCFLSLALATVASAQLPAPSPPAVWLSSPATNNWNTDTNWSPPNAPASPGEAAIFNTSSQTSPTLSAGVGIQSITFNAGASAFTIHTNGHDLSLFGAGIVNNSVTAQTIVNDNGGATSFFGIPSSGIVNLIRLVNSGATTAFDISFIDTAGMVVGSIEGDGTFFLGGKNLSVVGNGLSTTFSGVISDGGFDNSDTGGSLTKAGSGTLILTGANTYTGPTTVDGGSLIVDGSISSVLTSVNAGGLLGGFGSLDQIIVLTEPVLIFGGGDLLDSGIVSPGDPTGKLTVGGSYTQTAGGTLRIQVAGLGATEHGLLAVNGTATLAGTLQVIRLNNFQLRPGDQITFLTAKGGVNGTFSTVQNDFSTSGTIVGSQIIFLPDSVVLEATQGSFKTICQTPNDMAVGAALDSAVGDPRAAPLIEFLDSQPLSELCHDLDLISPEELTSMFNVGVSMANIQTDNLERRMNNVRGGSTGFSAAGFSINTRGRDFNLGLAGPSGPEGKSGPSVMQPTPENRWGVFVTGIGEFTDVDNTDNASGFYLSTGGVTFGVDYRVSPNFAIGMMGGYAHTNGDLVDGGSLDVDGGKIGVYATAFSGGFYVNAAATGGLNDYDTRRTALLGTASGDTDGREFTGLVAAGYDWKTGNLTVGPTASYQYTYVEFDGFTEHGSLVPLAFNDQSADSSRTALGAKASYDWHMGRVLVKPEIRAAWQHEFGDTDYSIVSSFANGAGSSFTVAGPAIGRDSLLVGAGAAVIFSDRISAYAYYDGELARTNYSSHNVSAGLRFTF